MRAELTALVGSHTRYAPPDDPLKVEFTTLSRFDRVRRMARAVEAKESIRVTSEADDHALKQLRRVARAPTETIGGVRDDFESVFRRLYRQRNLVIHGGRFDSPALPMVVATVAPLIGSVLDTLAWTSREHGWSPEHTADRARSAIGVAVPDRWTEVLSTFR